MKAARLIHRVARQSTPSAINQRCAIEPLSPIAWRADEQQRRHLFGGACRCAQAGMCRRRRQQRGGHLRLTAWRCSRLRCVCVRVCRWQTADKSRLAFGSSGAARAGGQRVAADNRQGAAASAPRRILTRARGCDSVRRRRRARWQASRVARSATCKRRPSFRIGPSPQERAYKSHARTICLAAALIDLSSSSGGAAPAASPIDMLASISVIMCSVESHSGAPPGRRLGRCSADAGAARPALIDTVLGSGFAGPCRRSTRADLPGAPIMGWAAREWRPECVGVTSPVPQRRRRANSGR
jgi:hypothetical protein